MVKMNKITILAIVMIFLAGTIFVGAKLISEKKIKGVKEIGCNIKYDKDYCKEQKKIKIEKNSKLKIDFIEDLKTGKGVYKIYNG